MITIQKFNEAEQSEIKDFVLDIQNNEFHLELTEDDQPDLKNIAHYFSNGGFWTAKNDSEIVGTIGLQRLDDQNAVLKKMFVNKDFRGRELGIAQKLYDTLLEAAEAENFQTIWLDTPGNAAASHKFYERNGFVQTDKASLPKNYSYPDKDSKIYRLNLK